MLTQLVYILAYEWTAIIYGAITHFLNFGIENVLRIIYLTIESNMIVFSDNTNGYIWKSIVYTQDELIA